MNIDVILILVILILCIVMSTLRFKNKNKYFLFISFIILYFVLIVREPVSDMVGYLNEFDRITQLDFSEIFSVNWEILYVLLNKIIGIVTSDERVFIAITSLIGLIGPYYFIKNYSNNYLISIILFIILGLFSYHFFVLRQTIAISIILLSVKYIKERKLIKFLLLIAIATLFHTSSCIFVIAYFICNCKITNKYIMLITVILIGCFVLKEYLVTFVYQLGYTEYLDYASNSDGYQRVLLFVIILIITTILYVNLNNKNMKDNNKENSIISISYNLVWLATFFQILSTEESLISRVTAIFAYGIILIIPNLISKLNDKQTRMIFNIIMVFMSIIYAILFPTILDYSMVF